MKNHTYYLRLASQHYLIEEIPENWIDLTTEEQDKFLADNAWQPFQDMEPDALIEHIEDLAMSFKLAAQNERIDALNEVKDRISQTGELSEVINAS